VFKVKRFSENTVKFIGA
jgi:serine/threonine protein kinase